MNDARSSEHAPVRAREVLRARYGEAARFQARVRDKATTGPVDPPATEGR